MRDSKNLLHEHGIDVRQREDGDDWVIVRSDGTIMLSGIPPWNRLQAWAEVERLTGKSWIIDDD